MFNLHDVKYCWQCHNFLIQSICRYEEFELELVIRDSQVFGIPVWWTGVNEGEKMDEKGEADDSRCKYRASDHRAGVIMADVFLQMSLFQLRLTRSTCTQRLSESSGLDRLSLGCLWPIITQQLLTHHTDTLNKTLHTKHTRLLPMAWWSFI